MSKQKSPTYPLSLGGVWMVGVGGYIGLQILSDGYYSDLRILYTLSFGLSRKNFNNKFTEGEL